MKLLSLAIPERFVKMAMAVALVGPAMALGACDMTAVTQKVSDIQAEVQADAQLICGFIPTVATIAAIIPGVGGVAPGAAAIATAICNAIAKAPPVNVQSARLRSLRLGTQTAVNVATVNVPGVGAVPISGTFVR